VCSIYRSEFCIMCKSIDERGISIVFDCCAPDLSRVLRRRKYAARCASEQEASARIHRPKFFLDYCAQHASEHSDPTQIERIAHQTDSRALLSRCLSSRLFARVSAGVRDFESVVGERTRSESQTPIARDLHGAPLDRTRSARHSPSLRRSNSFTVWGLVLPPDAFMT
jgi:hypothetical protein